MNTTGIKKACAASCIMTLREIEVNNQVDAEAIRFAIEAIQRLYLNEPGPTITAREEPTLRPKLLGSMCFVIPLNEEGLEQAKLDLLDRFIESIEKRIEYKTEKTSEGHALKMFWMEDDV